MSGLEEFRAALAPAGLGLVGVVEAERAALACLRGPDRDLLRGAASLVVVGSGGGTFWAGIPARERAGPDPIERAADRALGAALAHLGPAARLLDGPTRDRFDLRRLGELAGLGRVSPHLQLLIHPDYGPWISLRGLVVVPDPLPAGGPLADFDPCGPCARPCLDACPAGAYSREGPFRVERCAAHRLAETAPARHCASACHARAACPVGREQAYSPEEQRHRHRAGLPMLRRWFGGASAG